MDSSSLPKELLILVDESDYITGYKSKAECHQGEGVLHRAFSLFIFNHQKQLLIQKRSAEKPLWPFYWSNSVCSHPRKGESYEEAVIRRLREELGIETHLQFLFKFQYQTRYRNVGSENELCSVYIGQADGNIQANPKEIAEWKYIDPGELQQDMRARSHLYTPWFKMEWEHIRKHYSREIETYIRKSGYGMGAR